MRTYEQIKAGADSCKDLYPGFDASRCCVAVSWAALTGDSLDTATYCLHELTGKLPGRISWPEIIDAYRAMGWQVEPHAVTSRTVRTLARELTSGRYLVACSKWGHALAIVDGQTIDWSAGRLHRITKVWKLTKV